MYTSPLIIAETDSYAVVYKPPFMHTTPLSRRNPQAETLLDWYAALFPAVKAVKGKKEGEYGMLHRLDYETNGLAVIAKTQNALDDLLRQQEQGLFIKTYTAESAGFSSFLHGFPPPPFTKIAPPIAVESAFRPFGPGRKAVRPVLPPFPKNKDIALDKDHYYQTQILDFFPLEKEKKRFRVQIRRGFRHQIRCHLAWLGFPLLNDALYAGKPASGSILALKAVSLAFYDPESHNPLYFDFF
jgi:23S rRNA pseudouridine1911/1915/1917 synthase